MNLKNQDILLVDKPAGLSSFGVVARVRRVLTTELQADYKKRGLVPPKRVKVGHAGTLDPFATGLLILLLQKSGTKKATEFLKLDKNYQATIRLGATSTTGDPEGVITEHAVATPPTKAEITEVLRRFTGKITQKVPAFSAVKIDGRRAYDLSRKGIAVNTPTREITIYQLDLLDYTWPDLTISCRVSSGTYIRALGEDIGEALGTGAYLTALRRTKIGPYSLTDAVTLDDILADDNSAN